MLRAVVVFALVAVAVATSPFIDANVNSPLFASAGSQVRFVPRGGYVLAVPSTSSNGGARVVSIGADAQNPQSQAPIRKYYGNVGKERFQDINGNGLAAAGSLALSLDPTAINRIIRDPRLQAQTSTTIVSPFVAVPQFTQKWKSLPIKANDIVLTTNLDGVYYLDIFSGFSVANPGARFNQYLVVADSSIAAVYTEGLRLGGEGYAGNIAGNIFGQL
jgi:hypothetical protein